MSGDGMRLAVGHRSMTKMVQAAPKKTMDAFECIDGCRSNGSSSEVISLGRSTTRLDLRCLCPKTPATRRWGGPGKTKGTGKVQVYHYDDDSSDWNKLGNALSARKTRICLVPPSQYLVRGARLAVGAPYHDPGGLENKVRDTFACLRNAVAWSPMGNAINGNVKGDMSGWSVSLSDDGSRLALGGIEEDALLGP